MAPPVSLEDSPQIPLTTKEGWRHFVAHTPRPPTPPGALAQPDSPERHDYDRLRLDYLSNPITVNTPVLQRAALNVRRLLLLNRRQVSARRGLILSGDGGTGKSTVLTQVGRMHEHAATAQRRPHDLRNRIPVTYITLPTAATPRMLAAEFARFLGLPIARRSNITDITETVCRVLIDTGCQLVLVDELHNLSLSTRNGAEVSDHLKYFSERIPATFVYAGVDLEERNFFTGTRGKQIASRFIVANTKPFDYGTSEQREQWSATVATFGQALCLHPPKPLDLTRHSEYLYRRTKGMIGSLSHLVRAAAMDAILDGTETITRQHFDAIDLDKAAE
jgi:hypothetical protein